MRHFIKLFCAFVILSAAPALYAQSDGGTLVYNLAGISDGCGDTMNADECMGSDTSSTICRKTYCPSCGMDQTQTSSLCFTLLGNMGVCSCKPGGVTIDKYGNRWPNCTISGSCGPPR
jgi:hypothetical protein